MNNKLRITHHVLTITFWTAVWFIFFAPVLLGQMRLPSSDFSGQFHAFGLFQARQMAAGHLPIFSPGSYGGFPFAADVQAAVFYLPRWLTIFASLPWEFPYYALELEGLLHIWLAGLFTYGLAFHITRQTVAALFAAVAFALGGYLTSYPLLQLSVLETFTWLPLILLLLRVGVGRASSSKFLPFLLTAAIILGIAYTAGHPQTFLQISVLTAVTYLYLTVRNRWAWRWVAGIGGLMGLTAVGTIMIAAYPSWRYLALTTRSDTSYAFVSSGQPLLLNIQMLVPRIMAVWTPEYVGITAVALILIAWFARHSQSRQQHSEILFWLIVAFTSAWLALGDRGILFEMAYRFPGFSLFRQQERWLGLVSFSMALLAAQGLALWLQASLFERRRMWRQTAVTLTILLAIVGFILLLAQHIMQENWAGTWLRTVGLTAAALLLLGLNWRWRWQAWLLVLLLAVDLYLPISQAMAFTPELPSAFWPQPEWLTAVQSENPGRIDSRSVFHANIGEIYNLEDIRGLSPLLPQVAEKFSRLPRPVRWQLLNVTHVLAYSQVEPTLTQMGNFAESVVPGEERVGQVYRFEQAAPRAWMSYQPLIAPDNQAAFQRMKAPEFDPAAQVVFTADVIIPNNLVPPDSPPQVMVTKSAANVRQIEVSTAAPGYLVISEWAQPGWQAIINGIPADLLTADYALQALFLPTGDHTITLTYRLPGLALGTAVTLFTLLMAVIVAWRWQPVITTRPRSQTQSRPQTEPVLTAVNQPAISALAWRWSAAAITLLGFGLRLFRLGSQELRGDEAFSYLFARLPLMEIIPRLIGEGDPHSPFHYLLLHGWLNVAGDSEFTMRLLSLSPGVLLIPLLAIIGRQVGGRWLGLLMGLLTAVSPSLIWVGQDVRNQYTLTLFFTAAATYLLVRLTVQEPLKRGLRTFLGWGVYAGLAAAAVYSHYYGSFVLLAHGLFLLAMRPNRRWLAHWLAAGALALLLFVPWLTAVTPTLLSAGQLSDPAAPDLAKYLTTVGVETVAGMSATGWGLRWLFLGALLIGLVGLRTLWRERRDWAVLLASWLGLTTLAIYLIRFSRATFNPFYISVAAPAWWLLVGVGLLTLWHGRFRGQRVLAIVGVLGLVGTAVFSLHNYYVNPAFSRSRGYREMAAHIAADLQPGDVFVAHYPDPSLVYYLRDVPIPYMMQPSDNQLTQDAVVEELSALTADYDRLWFVPAGTSWDQADVVRPWLDFNTLPEQETTFSRLDLWAYRPAQTIDQIVTPVDQMLANGVRLAGVFVTASGQPLNLADPAAIEPGAELTVVAVWQAEGAIDGRYTAFVHLLNQDGTLVAQHDGIPVAGTRPTDSWQPGDQIIDVHHLTLPKGTAVQGQLLVGMYASDSLARQKWPDGRDALPIVTIKTAP
ncbi:MAG: hypothetical protein GY796_05345 [Chloroflexi bacterium]|nr:hypothetical protein [Chloroflexota bacterium]